MDESRYIKKALIASLGFHVVAILLNPELLFMFRREEEELAIEAQMIIDLSGQETKDSLAKKDKDEEIKVTKEILPQLSKQFVMKENEQKDQIEPTPSNAPEKSNPIASDDKDDPVPPEDEKKIVEKKPEPPPKEKEKKEAKVDPTITELMKKDAIERLLKEKARREQKFAETEKAPEPNTLLAKRRESLANGKELGSEEFQKYNQMLKDWVQKYYVLPEIYANADALAVVEFALSSKGELTQLELKESSKNPAFDQLALRTMKIASPFPKPPIELVGRPIHFRFDSKM